MILVQAEFKPFMKKCFVPKNRKKERYRSAVMTQAAIDHIILPLCFGQPLFKF
jgi:hypothetical protein